MRDLYPLFHELNHKFFDGRLPEPVLKVNARLRATAGRFIPGGRIGFLRVPRPAVIEIAEYLFEEEERHLRDTMAHEMIHYWLWVRRRPYGHTREFLVKMRQIGATRYNPVPRLKPARYLYACPHCSKEMPARRKLGNVACLHCCRTHARGQYDVRFRLTLVRDAKNAPAPS